MKLNVYNEVNKTTFVIDVENSTTIEVVKLKICASQNLNYNLLKINFQGQPLNDPTRTIGSYKIMNNDMIVIQGQNVVQVQQRPQYPQQQMQPQGYNQFQNMNFFQQPNYHQQAQQLMSRYLNNPQQLELLCQQDEQLAAEITTENVGRVATLLQQRAQQQQQNMFSSVNQFDPDYQKKLEEQIHKQRLHQVYEETYQNYPELFVPTEMLFISGKINGKETDIFVDTGAQTTIISLEFAEKANLTKFIDKRFSGLVLGVGQQTSVGKIWQCQLEINGRFFVLSATVLKNFGHDVLLGLDMMKRHHCVLDLSNFGMIFGSNENFVSFYNDQSIQKMKMKNKEHDIQKLQDVLQIDSNAAKQLLERFNFDVNQAIASELIKRNQKTQFNLI